MGFFKKVCELATDEFKKSIEESKKEMLKGLLEIDATSWSRVCDFNDCISLQT